MRFFFKICCIHRSVYEIISAKIVKTILMAAIFSSLQLLRILIETPEA